MIILTLLLSIGIVEMAPKNELVMKGCSSHVYVTVMGLSGGIFLFLITAYVLPQKASKYITNKAGRNPTDELATSHCRLWLSSLPKCSLSPNNQTLPTLIVEQA